MESWFDWRFITDPNIQMVVLGTVLLNIAAAVVGTFAYLQKKSLVGDAVSHAILPGVCLSFILVPIKSLYLLIPSAFISGWIALYCVDHIIHHSKLKQDTAISFVLSFFFSLGIVGLSFIQKMSNGNQSGIDQFLFGKAASIVSSDIKIYGLATLFILLVVVYFFKTFTLISFDSNYAQSIGIPIKKHQFVLTSLMVLSVVIGIQAVGIVLMSAMLITPAAAARFWTHHIKPMIWIAVGFNIAASGIGAYISYRFEGMPTGPWIVICLSILALFSFSFAPNKGWVYQWYIQRKHYRKIQFENILKFLYKHQENKSAPYLGCESKVLFEKFNQTWSLPFYLIQLKYNGFIKKEKNHFQLTNEGLRKGQHITRLHRLWEMYLTKELNIPIDHVHDNAEAVEHIIGPELESKLDQELNFPKTDPHQSNIPQSPL